MAEESSVYIGFFSGNQLKVIACIAMLIDHIGWILFPGEIAFRIIGRISMPLVAFLFGEGCHYMRHKARHFAFVCALGVLTSAVMSFVMKEPYGNILITFSLSCPLIYALEGLKKFSVSGRKGGAALCAGAFVCALALAVWLCCFSPLDVDYGIAGVLLPVCVRLLDVRSFGVQGKAAQLLFSPVTALLPFFAGMVALMIAVGGIQFFSVMAVPLLVGYSGKRGKYALKWLFYTFYPAHLALLGAIYLIIHPIFCRCCSGKAASYKGAAARFVAARMQGVCASSLSFAG